MSAVMGGEASSQEDMFAKLENMRAVITEVNTQFKDPVCLHASFPIFILKSTFPGKDHLRLCLYLRVLVGIRDRTPHPRINGLRNRHA